MNIYIGENIKSLRKEKNITQEKLAEHLNISYQAISKWERGETFPDISMIIPIASYFGVNTDELLGFNKAENEKRIQEYLDEYYRLGALGKLHDKFNLICEAYKAFPNDFRIIEEYAWQLHNDYNGDGKYQEELYKICDRILNECTLDKPRYSALSILRGLYSADSKMPPEENIKIFRKAIDIFNIIYDNGDYGFNFYHLTELSIWIGNRYIMRGDYEKAAEHLERGLSYAKTYHELSLTTPHTSFLVDKLTFDKIDTISGYEGNCIARELNFIDDNDFYDIVRDMDWFKSIIEKYRAFA